MKPKKTSFVSNYIFHYIPRCQIFDENLFDQTESNTFRVKLGQTYLTLYYTESNILFENLFGVTEFYLTDAKSLMFNF